MKTVNMFSGILALEYIQYLDHFGNQYLALLKKMEGNSVSCGIGEGS